MFLASGFVLIVQVLVKLGCKHTKSFRSDRSKKNYDAQAGIMGHILNDFRGNVLRQNVLQNVSLLYFPF